MLEYPHSKPWVWLSVWVALITITLYLRPLMPVDETRYLSVAWEMWLRQDFLVPHLNGQPYSHKPPLLFWIINLGWSIFGVVDWWPRTIAPLFGLACLFLSQTIYKRLWPDPYAHSLVPIILLGTFYWGIYMTLTMFDLIVTFWTLLGITGLIMAIQGRILMGWALFSISIGLGILSKGPVILIYLLPLALFAPYWAKTITSQSWIKWFLYLAASLLLGMIIAFAWVLPAANGGGEDYRNAILWGQSAGRIVSSFAHKKPVWWYIVVIPGMLLPWILWPSLILTSYSKLIHKPLKILDPGVRLLLVWLLPSLIMLSLISGKQPHYLLPILPAFGIGCARLISKMDDKHRVQWYFDLLPFFTLICIVILIVVLNEKPLLILNISTTKLVMVQWWLILPISFCLIIFFKRPHSDYGKIISIFFLGPVLIISLTGTMEPTFHKFYDLQPISNYLKKIQDQGYAVANYGKYHGQFHYLGKLKKPIVVTGDGEIKHWLAKNPKAKIVAVRKTINGSLPKPEFMQRYRNNYLIVWDRSTVIKDPTIAQRK